MDVTGRSAGSQIPQRNGAGHAFAGGAGDGKTSIHAHTDIDLIGPYRIGNRQSLWLILPATHFLGEVEPPSRQLSCRLNTPVDQSEAPDSLPVLIRQRGQR